MAKMGESGRLREEEESSRIARTPTKEGAKGGKVAEANIGGQTTKEQQNAEKSLSRKMKKRLSVSTTR